MGFGALGLELSLRILFRVYKADTLSYGIIRVLGLRAGILGISTTGVLLLVMLLVHLLLLVLRRLAVVAAAAAAGRSCSSGRPWFGRGRSRSHW